MRILVISHMYPTKANPLSGIFVRKQAEALLGCGAEVTLVNPTPWVPSFFKGRTRWGNYAEIPSCEMYRGMEVYHPRVVELPKGYLFAHYPKSYILGMSRTVDRLFREKRFDLIHAHVAHPDGAAAVHFGEKYNLPVVVTIHGQDFAHTLKRSPRCARSVKDTLGKADKVILVSDKLRYSYGLEEWADDLSKYEVIYNGVHLEDIAGIQDNSRKTSAGVNREAKPGGPVLLTVGFLREPKGHTYVLEALPRLLAKYPNLVYRIVGDGAERKKLEELTSRLGLKDHVEFKGSLPHDRAMQEMAKCDIFVMPSWNEAFGVVYLEAMAHGKPVIGTKGEGIAPLIEKEGVGLTVPPRDSEAVARAVDKLLGVPQQAGEMGERGRKLVRSKFTWEHNARRTLDVYREAIDRHK